MGLLKLLIVTQSEAGQGSGTSAEVSAEAGIEGLSHFEQASLHGGLSRGES